MPKTESRENKTSNTDSERSSNGAGGNMNFLLKLLEAFDKLQQRIRHEVLLFALGYLLLLFGIFYLGDRLVTELKILITLLPFVALLVYAFVVGPKDTNGLGASQIRPKRNRRNQMTSSNSDRDQYDRVLGYLNRLTENEFLDVRQHMLRIEELNTSSGGSRVHFMGDMRVIGKMEALEKFLLEKYPERLMDNKKI